MAYTLQRTNQKRAIVPYSFGYFVWYFVFRAGYYAAVSTLDTNSYPSFDQSTRRCSMRNLPSWTVKPKYCSDEKNHISSRFGQLRLIYHAHTAQPAKSIVRPSRFSSTHSLPAN